MDATEYARRYAAAEVTVTDRRRVLLLVFEGGTRFLRLAREALARGDAAAFAEHLARAQAIVAELLGTLDHEAGGTLAADLARLYEFILFHLTEANARRSLRHVDEAIVVFDIIADGFRTILSGGAALAGGAA
jgi:flagellar protein FliS